MSEVMNPDSQALLKLAVSQGRIKSLRGQVICFTGKMSMPRTEMHSLVTVLGGQISMRVDNHTTLLVVASWDTTSEKMQQANKRGVMILDETTFTEGLRISPADV